MQCDVSQLARVQRTLAGSSRDASYNERYVKRLPCARSRTENLRGLGMPRKCATFFIIRLLAEKFIRATNGFRRFLGFKWPPQSSHLVLRITGSSTKNLRLNETAAITLVFFQYFVHHLGRIRFCLRTFGNSWNTVI